MQGSKLPGRIGLLRVRGPCHDYLVLNDQLTLLPISQWKDITPLIDKATSDMGDEATTGGL